MKRNQAFEILSRATNPHDAKVVIENTTNFSAIKIWLITRALKKGVPVAKIIHQKWFYGLKFYTNRYTLDPRPDTETLVSAVISDCKSDLKPTILDLGTGTGCIIAALVKNIPGATGLATDISRKALRIAHKNMLNLGIINKVKLSRKNFNYSGIFNTQFDIIVSNPPYIPYGDKRVNLGAHYDPKLALYTKNDGLSSYEEIAKNALHWIKTGGKIYLEIGEGQKLKVKKIFTQKGWTFDRAEKDLAGIDRVLVFQK